MLFSRGQKNENSPLKTVFLIQVIFWKILAFSVFSAKPAGRPKNSIFFCQHLSRDY